MAALFHEQGRAEAESAWLEAVSRIISGGYAFLLEQERFLAPGSSDCSFQEGGVAKQSAWGFFPA